MQNKNLLSSVVSAALVEDLGQGGDITSLATIPADHQSSAAFVARNKGAFAGLDVALEVFQQIDPTVKFEAQAKDSDIVEPNTILVKVSGSTRSILAAERTALNFMSHLSGIATATYEFMQLISHTKAKITDTRKTTPGLRELEKYAVRMGGGVNHRLGLYDAILIKDNHIAALNGDISLAVKKAKNYTAIQDALVIVEIDNLNQIELALEAGADRLLLDNMTVEQLKKAVQIIAGRAIIEASGRINKNTVKAIAETGVNLISVGAITHSASILDIGLDWTN